MNKNWMTVCFVLAMLIISLAPLSSATCPWVIRNELYSAQCGVIKEVPASSGILANDPGATAVLKPEGISIDPEYGTVKVEADGSFLYDPSPNIQTGTYVTFQYNATNGACGAENLGSAKILVSCKCRPNIMDMTVCMPRDLNEVKAKLIAAGAGCLECGDNMPVFDLSLVKLQPGTYPYLIKCQDCTAVTGLLTITGMCQAYAPDITLCEGEVALAELLEMIDENAGCSGQDSDPSLAINVDNVAVENGSVTDGSYTVTCGEGTAYESSATGKIISRGGCKSCSCVAVAAPIEVCLGGVTKAALKAMIRDGNASCEDFPGLPCDFAPKVNLSDVDVDYNGYVTGGSYMVTCGLDPSCLPDWSTVTAIDCPDYS